MKILSIDWDVFFPDSAEFDWGHQEIGMFYEEIWSHRLSSLSLHTGERAVDKYTLSLPERFWEKVLTNKPTAYVADSHFRIYNLLMRYKEGVQVVNLDAHNDFGYSDQFPSYIDCGNWALVGKMNGFITKYSIYYPEWRKNYKEGNEEVLDEEVIDHVDYGLPDPDEYDIVFICRSSSWTPPWFDKAFKEFVEAYPGKIEDFDAKRGLKLRKLSNLEEVKVAADKEIAKMRELIAELQKKD